MLNFNRPFEPGQPSRLLNFFLLFTLKVEIGFLDFQKTLRTVTIVVSIDIPRSRDLFRSSEGYRPDSFKQ
jgi:hypothetical protein